MKRKIVFLTGTRADYGKIKSLIRCVEASPLFEAYIFATGMHMLSKYGSTYLEIKKDNFNNLYTYINQNHSQSMDLILSNTILGFSNYVEELKPDAIIVHGDRLEALAGAIVGAFNNIRVFHIEGGEVSGTIDESIRHAVTKFAHYHLVANEQAKKRIIQLGEAKESIFVVGSPDIDIMLSRNLPDIETVFKYYDINFSTNYCIAMYHPVTTEVDILSEHAKQFVDALIESKREFVVIYPNNDSGTDIIIQEYKRLFGSKYFRIIPSMKFEYFLTLLKNSKCILGNSSSGIREAGVYGIPAVDVGSRQTGRYVENAHSHIVHAEETVESILTAIKKACQKNLLPFSEFGDGKSTEKFFRVISNKTLWETPIQKRFNDIDF